MTGEHDAVVTVAHLGHVQARAVDEDGNAYDGAAVHLTRVHRRGGPSMLELTAYGRAGGRDPEPPEDDDASPVIY